MKQRDLRVKGLILAVCSMIIYGLNPIFAHYFVKNIDPLLLGGLSLIIASLPLLFHVKFYRKIRFTQKKIFLHPLFFIVFFASIAEMLFYIGTKLTSGINTALLIQIEPIYSIILASVFLGEIIKIRQIFAILTIVTGAAVVIYKGSAALNLGDVLVILSPLFYQLSHLNAKRIINKVPDENIIPGVRLFYAGALLTILALVGNPLSFYQLFSLVNVASIVMYGIYLSLDYFLWYQVLKRLPLPIASAFLPFAVFVSLFGATVFLKEPIVFHQYIGILFIVVGLLWLSTTYIRYSIKKDKVG